MTYRISTHEVELLLSFYRDIQKYNDLLNMELKDAHYGVDSQIYAAFKLDRVSESVKISYIRDYCVMIKKTMKSWENDKYVSEYKAYRAIQLKFLGKRSMMQKCIERKIGCPSGELRRMCLDRGIETFKRHLIKQLRKLNYTQSDSQSIIADESYNFEYNRNLELMFYVVSNIAQQSKDYFSKIESVSVSDKKIHNINAKQELKEVS